MQPSQGTAWSRPISRPCSTSVPLLQWPPLGSVLGSLAAPPPRLLCSEKGCWTAVRPPVQSREREESQGWWRLGRPRYLGEEEEKDPAWWRRRGGSSGDARVAGALAVPGRQSPQLEDSEALSRWCRLSQWEHGLGRAPLVPALLPARRDRRSRIGCAVYSDVWRGVGGGGACATPSYPLPAGGRQDCVGPRIWVGLRRPFS